MRFSKTAALALLATSASSSPLNGAKEGNAEISPVSNQTQLTDYANLALLKGSVQQAALEAEKTAFAQNFLKALTEFIYTNEDEDEGINHEEGADVTTSPLFISINTTVNAILHRINTTIPTCETDTTDEVVQKRSYYGNPVAWEYSNGRRKAPCPGWPIKVRYNDTHWREWTFTRGYVYGELDPRCPVAGPLSQP